MTALKTMTYRGTTCTETNTTTDGVRMVHGKQYPCVKFVWALEGAVSKPAGQRPFLTSAKACREYVAQVLESGIR